MFGNLDDDDDTAEVSVTDSSADTQTDENKPNGGNDNGTDN